jgi:putative ABC transport system permease protein
MARQYWPTGDPLRDQITIGHGLGPGLELPARQIVGIVGDVRDGGLNFTPGPTMYVPWAQMPDGHSANLLEITPLAWIVRTRGEPLAARSAIQQELRQVSGGLPVAHSRTMDDVVGRSTARINFNMFLMTIFGGAALLLAAIGIYGLMAYSVQQRTQEIGIRGPGRRPDTGAQHGRGARDAPRAGRRRARPPAGLGLGASPLHLPLRDHRP